jgi:hypothetical protein
MSFRRTSRNVVLGAAAWVVAGATVLAVAGRTIQVTPLARAGRMDRADSTETEDVAHDFLTTFDRLPLFSSAGLEPNVEYDLRVRAQTTPPTSWALWSLWDRHDVAGVAKFTFIP